jgi:hypothetical protein
MSRVENSDDQRIREMQETELRQRADREKRGEQERVSKSFQEVMQQRAGKQASQTAAEKQTQQRGPAKGEQGASARGEAQAGAQSARAGEQLARRAALASQALHGQMHKARAEMNTDHRRADNDRSADLVQRSDDEREMQVADQDKADLKDRELEEGRAELQTAERKQEAAAGDPFDATRERQKRNQGGGQKDEREGKAENVAKADASRGPNAPRLPPEIVEAIAKSIQVALAGDGKTEISIALKGPMLDGVTLTVTARKGKVRCTFEGCDKQTAALIESSRGELMRQLSKRGLDLDYFKAKVAA